jgi:hypothetical protein
MYQSLGVPASPLTKGGIAWEVQIRRSAELSCRRLSLPCWIMLCRHVPTSNTG